METEKLIWKGRPSQWTNFSFYFLCGVLVSLGLGLSYFNFSVDILRILLLSVLGLGLVMAIWKYFDTRCNKLEVTDQRIIEHRGIFSKTTNEVELYRVKDIRLVRPFWLRMVGLSSVWLDSTDHSNPTILLKGIANGKEIKEQLRIAIDIRRDIKGVREVDFKQ